MKHPRFAGLGANYPTHLEEHFDRVLTNIDQLWDKPELDAYFTDLLIDKRGGRKGFPAEVLNDILRLRETREIFDLQQAERREHAKRELDRRALKPNDESFLKAVIEGDRESIDLYVRSGYNIHITDDEGNSPLLLALSGGSIQIAKLLIENGADLSVRTSNGQSALFLANQSGDADRQEVIDLLMSKGADF